MAMRKPVTPAFGRRFALDHRDGRFLFRSIVRRAVVRPRSLTWYLRERLDQGPFPHCVGYSWAHVMRAKPKQQVRGIDPDRIYHAAQLIDEWAGEAYDGTSVRAGAAVLLAEKRIKEYRWAFSADDVIDALTFGPVVMGTGFPYGMRDADREGVVHYTADAGRNDGHAYALVGIRKRGEQVVLHNSWGRSYGIDGRALLPAEDLEEALRDAGECCVPIE